MGHTVGLKFVAQVGLGTLVPYRSYLVFLVKTFGGSNLSSPNYQIIRKKKKKEEPLLMNLKLCLRSIYYLGNVDLNLGV